MAISRPIAPVLVLALALGATACTRPSTAQTINRARSDITASAFALERYAAGDSTRPFTSASVDQYASALAKSERELASAQPPQQDALDAVKDARAALESVSGNVTKEAAHSAAQRLRADAAKLEQERGSSAGASLPR